MLYVLYVMFKIGRDNMDNACETTVLQKTLRVSQRFLALIVFVDRSQCVHLPVNIGKRSLYTCMSHIRIKDSPADG